MAKNDDPMHGVNNELKVMKTQLGELTSAIVGLGPLLKEMTDLKQSLREAPECGDSEEGEVTDSPVDDFTVTDPGSMDQDDAPTPTKLLEDLANDIKATEICGPAILPKLVEVLNSVCANGMTDDKVASRAKQFVRPENCKGLTVPKVNPEIGVH